MNPIDKIITTTTNKLMINENINNMFIVEKKQHYTLSEFYTTFPNKKICLCDFHVSDIPLDLIKKEGYIILSNLIIIDHHADLDQMRKFISSTNIALDYMKSNKKLSNEDWVIVTNHTDTDAVLSSLIMSGYLPPDQKYGEAAIAADHTGTINIIADLLQANDKVGLDNSIKLLESLNEDTKLALNNPNLLIRLAERDELQKMVDTKNFKKLGKVWYCITDKEYDPNLAVCMLPEAMIIVFGYPGIDMPGRSKWSIRVRLGQAGYGKINFKKFTFLTNDKDYSFGGRWNAMSNRRSKSSIHSLEQVVKVLHEHISTISTKLTE